MPWITPRDQIYTIVQADSDDIQKGQLVYVQNRIIGTPVGLLVALTSTPIFTLMIKTDNGLRRIN